MKCQCASGNNLYILIATITIMIQLKKHHAVAISSPEHSDHKKVHVMDLHPASSYLRWLNQQLELVDDEQNQLAESKGSSSLRRLKDDKEVKQQSDERKQFIQDQINQAISSLKDTGAAYASLTEFNSLSSNNNEDSSNNSNHPHERHLKQSYNKLYEHNVGVQDYNENWRRYSRYEWAEREGRGEDSFVDEVDVDIDNNFIDRSVMETSATEEEGVGKSNYSKSLMGTSWKAVEISFLNQDSSTNSTTVTPIIPSANTHIRPLTLTFDETATHISGSTGCNNYHGGVTLHSNSTTIEIIGEGETIQSFTTGFMGITKMRCHGEEGVLDIQEMTQMEMKFMWFLTGKTFYYEIVDGNELLSSEESDGVNVATKERSVEDDETEEVVAASFIGLSQLLLYEPDTTSIPGHSLPGKIIARFVPLIDEATAKDEKITRRRKLQTDVKAKKKGGMFNAYQTSPLHQGYGTHYATIWVGTPSQRKSVIIDTGSHFTAFPCKGCYNCGEEHHTDKYFDPEASTTFRALTCDECHAATCQHDKCVFSQTYTEGSSWHAYESVDKVFIGAKELSSALDPINYSFKTDFLFGCQMKETGLFVTQLADGIMGMSAHPSTLPRAMYEQGKLEHNMFSMCFRRELHVSKQGIVAGLLTLGGIDSRKDFAPMVYARNVASSGWFTVFVKNVFIRENGGQSANADGPHQKLRRINADLYQMNSGKGVIIDSGTTDTYLHESIAKPFETVWERVTGGRKYANEPVKMDKEDILLLPTVLVQMAAYSDNFPHHGEQIDKISGLAGEIDPSSPLDVILAIPATHYMEYSPSKGTYTPRIYFTESKGGVIGANAMQGHNVLFDWENKRVGFAESSCEYQQESLTVTDEGVMSVDCKLGAPSLSVSCSDSADLSQCESPLSKPDTALQGLEIWTRIVQAPGTAKGLTCAEVANAQNEENAGGPMEVNCDGKGVCREVRKCVISCANAIAHGTAASKNSGLSPIGSCGGVGWSACDYTCSQTKVESTLMNDGKCHEEKSKEVTRPCHVQACGRSDPCRVPFVVHAIIKIRGAVASHWTKHAEEIFIEAFTAMTNEKRKEKDPYFEPGDVTVLNASPWRASDDTVFGVDSLEGEDEELGMQIVVEISIFNPNAEMPPSRHSKGILLSTCHERDMQPLANIALNIHKKLAEPNFVDAIVGRMDGDKALGEKQMSPFFYTFKDRKLAQASQVVTSWTIKTDIGAGTTRIDFNAFKYGFLPMDILLLILLIGITVYSCWSLRLWELMTKRDEATTKSSTDGRGRYSRVRGRRKNRQGEDSDTIMAIADHIESDDRSVMTGMTGASQSSYGSEGGRSTASIGSLSVYLAKTSKR